MWERRKISQAEAEVKMPSSVPAYDGLVRDRNTLWPWPPASRSRNIEQHRGGTHTTGAPLALPFVLSVLLMIAAVRCRV